MRAEGSAQWGTDVADGKRSGTTNGDARLVVIVGAVDQVAEDVRTYELVAPDGSRLPAFTAGAHVDLHLQGDVVRQYSICSSPRDREKYVIAVKREALGRGGSRRIYDELSVGSRVWIGTPRNNFPLSRDAACHLLLGGGIGVTPLLAMAEQLHAEGRYFELLFFGRTARSLPFAAFLRCVPWANRVRVHVDSPDDERKLDVHAILTDASRNSHLYICGPEGFISHVRTAALREGYPEESLHTEYFAAPTAQVGALRGGDASASFLVHAVRSGLSTLVEPGQSIVDALRVAGVSVPVSCEQGICGSCVVDYLRGVPEHHDLCLSREDRRNRVALCCARSAGPELTLDI